jgi:hypothetical protein
MPLENDAPDLAAFIPFESHSVANATLEQVGYSECRHTAAFSPGELCDRINELLVTADGLVLMDMTTTIPDTSHAAYQALTVAGFTAASACKKDDKAAFMVMRTESNTPSFLFGSHWATTQALGKDVADAQIRNMSTPVLVVFHQDCQTQLPTSVVSAGLDITARVVAHELTKKAEFLCCDLCGTSFVRRGENGFVSVDEIGVSPSGHFFRRECALKYIEAGNNCTPSQSH